MSEVRQRKGASDHGPVKVDIKKVDSASFGVIDVLRVLGGLLLLNCLLSYFITNDSLLWGWRPWFVRPSAVGSWLKGPVYLTDAELLEYNGSDPNKPIYLALNGTIYDVTANPRMYGPGASYNKLTGKDATRSYITSCFDDDLSPDIRGAEWAYVPADIPTLDEPATAAQKTAREQELRKARKMAQLTVEHWAKMFRGDTGKDYFEVGKVKRPDNWLDGVPIPKLCASAQKNRPKSQQAGAAGGIPAGAGAGAQYRGGGRPQGV